MARWHNYNTHTKPNMLLRVTVIEAGKEYVVSKRDSWSELKCSCPYALFKHKKCRHIVYVERNKPPTDSVCNYDPMEGDCGREYVRTSFDPGEWTDPEEALAVALMREISMDKKDFDKQLKVLRKKKERR